MQTVQHRRRPHGQERQRVIRRLFGFASWEGSMTPEAFAVQQRRRRRVWLAAVLVAMVVWLMALL